MYIIALLTTYDGWFHVLYRMEHFFEAKIVFYIYMALDCPQLLMHKKQHMGVSTNTELQILKDI